MGRPAAKRMSLAVANSVMMAPAEESNERGGVIREFLYAHIKSIVTIFMIFGTLGVIVVIVMGKYNFTSSSGVWAKPCIV